MPLAVAGVIGAGEGATERDMANAFRLGELLAEAGWVVLSGGRDAGVMAEVSRGAKSKGGLTVGVLPDADCRPSPHVDVAVVTGMHNARNNINVLTSHVVIASGDGGAGTASEVALALKAGKPVILLGADEVSRAFYRRLAGGRIAFAESVEEAVAEAARYRPSQQP
jgi:hypothetical protein